MKKCTHLQPQDRQRIFVLSANGYSIAAIASDLHHHPSTIRREFARYGSKIGYDDKKACQQALNVA